MIDSRHPDSVSLCPMPMLTCNPKIRINQTFGSDSAQANNDLGPNQSYLIAQVRNTCLLFRFLSSEVEAPTYFVKGGGHSGMLLWDL